MTPKTRPYRNQHVELQRLIAAIPLDSAALDPREAGHAISCLKSVLVVHVKLQDGMLYPWMTHHGAPEIREKGRHFRTMMDGLQASFMEFHRRWNDAASIAADPEGFIAEWHMVRAVLRHRIDSEAADLYPAIERIQELEIPLAS